MKGSKLCKTCVHCVIYYKIRTKTWKYTVDRYWCRKRNTNVSKNIETCDSFMPK